MNRKSFATKLGAANSMHQITSKDRWEYLPMIKSLLKARRDGTLKPAEVHFAMSAMRQAFDERAAAASGKKYLNPNTAAADRFYEIISSAAPLTSFATDIIRDVLKTSTKGDEGNWYARQEASRGTTFINYSGQALEILNEAHAVAQTDPDFATYWNRFLGRDIGGVGLDPEAIFASNPALLPLRTTYETGSEEKTTPDATVIEDAVRASSKQILDEVDAVRQDFANQKATIADLHANVARMAEHMEAIRQQEKSAQKFNAAVEGFHGALAIYAAFGGNPATVRALQTVVNAATGIRAAIDGYQKSIAAAGTSGLLTAASNLTLMGSFITIAASFSVAGEPDREAQFQEMVVESLARMSDQIRDLHQDLINGIQHLDSRLEAGVRSIMGGLDALHNSVQENTWRTTILQESVNNLSKRLAISTAEILVRLDFVIKQQYVDGIDRLRSYKDVSGLDLPAADFINGLHLLLAFLKTARQPFYAGNKVDVVDDVLESLSNVGLTADLGSWPNHVYTYRTVLRALGSNAISDGDMPNPIMWASMARSLVDIQVNNAPTQMIGANPINLFLEAGESILDEPLHCSCGDFAESADIMRCVKLFLKLSLSDAVSRVRADVLNVHRGVLAANGAKLEVLDTWIAFTSTYEELDRTEWPKEWDAGGKAIQPLRTHERVTDRGLFLKFGGASGPLTQAESDQMYESDHLKHLKPSFESPTTWPDLPLTKRVWDSFPLEARTIALQCEALGIGDISFKYQASVDSMFLQDISTWPTWSCDVLWGTPVVYYCLGITKDDVFTKLAVGSSTINTFGNRPVAMKIKSGINEYIPLTFDFRIHLQEIGGSGRPIESIIKIDLAAVRNLLIARYRSLAFAVHNNLYEFASALDTPLGRSLDRLTLAKTFLQGLCGWLYPDLLNKLDSLRFALTGYWEDTPTQTKVAAQEGFVPQYTAPETPLLDRDLVLRLFAVSPDDPTKWSEYQNFIGLPELITRSGQLFMRAYEDACSVPVTLRTGHPDLVAAYNVLIDFNKLMERMRAAT